MVACSVKCHGYSIGQFVRIIVIKLYLKSKIYTIKVIFLRLLDLLSYIFMHAIYKIQKIENERKLSWKVRLLYSLFL